VNTFTERAQRVGRAAERPGTRKEAKIATRAKVLAAAKEQLEALGFEPTSIRGIARAAGVATGTVLLHFPDKRELLHAAMFEDLAATWEKTKAAASPKGRRSLHRQLSAIAAGFFAYYAERPVLSRVLLRESLFSEPPWSTRFAAQVADVHQHVARLAGAARERGEIDPSIDTAVLGASFFAFYYFALLAWLQGGHEAPQRLFDRMLEEHLRPLPQGRRKTSR
jgi:AcrR family transcriptional regulator